MEEKTSSVNFFRHILKWRERLVLAIDEMKVPHSHYKIYTTKKKKRTSSIVIGSNPKNPSPTLMDPPISMSQPPRRQADGCSDKKGDLLFHH
jgi:hypothetical protein